MAHNLNVSHVTISGSISEGPVSPAAFLPNDANLFPKWPFKLDKDAWEEWQVQGLAADGSTAIVVIFFRHRLNAPAGFRVGIIASWAGDGRGKTDDTVWCSHVALPHSVITWDAARACLCGVWRGEEADDTPPFAKFDIAADLSHSLFTFNVPGKVIGTIALTSSAGYDALPQTEATGRFMPTFWWLRPMAMAGVTADLTFFPLDGSRDDGPKALRMREDHGAFGAVERGWTASPLPRIISHNWWLWGRAGPYVIQVIWVQGRMEDQSPLWGSGRLYRDGELVSAPQRAVGIRDALHGGKESNDSDSLTLDYLFDDSGDDAKGSFLGNTGHLIIFRSGGQTWNFKSRHARAWYNIPTSPPGPDATGLSGFVLEISGGIAPMVSTDGSSELFSGPGIAGGGTMS